MSSVKVPLNDANSLAAQLAAAFARITNNASNPLVIKTLQLLLDGLERGQVSISLSLTVMHSGAKDVDSWKKILLAQGVAGDPSSYHPLIIDGDELYLARYYHYQHQLQRCLLDLSRQDIALADETANTEALERLFPANSTAPNWQKVAAALALSKRLCVISGGPGTGKTTTVLCLLAALLEAAKASSAALRICLAAPTGKAAARLQESVRNGLQALNTTAEIKQQLAVEACTLHRLLGYRPNSVNFRHNADNPLALDVVVVDESSMVDSAMMVKFLNAVPEGARVILLGDKDQLAAVEPGSPFADMCDQFGFSAEFAQRLQQLSGEHLINADCVVATPQPLADNLVFLRHSYRFGADSGIGNLARAINNNDMARAMSLLHDEKFADISWRDYQASAYRRVAFSRDINRTDPLADKIAAGYGAYRQALQRYKTPAQIFAAFDQFCVLTALRLGYCGLEEVNQITARALGLSNAQHWYHGRPVMVTKNDYQTDLYNGDVGICLDANNGRGEPRLRVYFASSAGFRDFSPSRVPVHDTAFAITVHKSQGSEFSEVLLLLPETKSKILSKALVYTAVTRAKTKVEMWGMKDVGWQ